MSFNVFIVRFSCLKFLWTDLQFICGINNRLRPLEHSASLFPLQNQNKRLNTLRSFMCAVRLQNGSLPEPDVTAVNCFSRTVLCTICDDRLILLYFIYFCFAWVTLPTVSRIQLKYFWDNATVGQIFCLGKKKSELNRDKLSLLKIKDCPLCTKRLIKTA